MRKKLNVRLKNQKNKLAITKTLIYTGLGIGAWGLTTIPSPLYAQTDVQAFVCGTDSEPKISIARPDTDSTVSSTDIKLEGRVANSNQIVVLVDEQYDQTLAISPSQTTYDLDVSTSPSTHTIKLTARGVCNGATSTANVVVTVRPNGDSSLPKTDTLTTENIPSSPKVSTNESRIPDTDGDFLRDPINYLKKLLFSTASISTKDILLMIAFAIAVIMLVFGKMFVNYRPFQYFKSRRRLLSLISIAFIVGTLTLAG